MRPPIGPLATLKFARRERESPVGVVAFSLSQGRIPTKTEVSVPPTLSGIGKGSVNSASSLTIFEMHNEMAQPLQYNSTIGRL